jgi:hypothetical protein
VVAAFYTRSHINERYSVSNEKNGKGGQRTREEFYAGSAVKQHIKTAGVPRTVGAFRAMVASGSSVDLDSPDGASLIETLGYVTFSKHPQQINIMDKASSRVIASIAA